MLAQTMTMWSYVVIWCVYVGICGRNACGDVVGLKPLLDLSLVLPLKLLRVPNSHSHKHMPHGTWQLAHTLCSKTWAICHLKGDTYLCCANYFYV